MEKSDYMADLKKWLQAATKTQAMIIWVFSKNYLKK